jgi:hypothetical protein
MMYVSANEKAVSLNVHRYIKVQLDAQAAISPDGHARTTAGVHLQASVLPRLFPDDRLTVGFAVEGYTHSVTKKSSKKSRRKGAKDETRVKLIVRRRDTWWARVRVWRGVFVKFGTRIRASPRGGLSLGFPRAEFHVEYDPGRAAGGDRGYWGDSASAGAGAQRTRRREEQARLEEQKGAQKRQNREEEQLCKEQEREERSLRGRGCTSSRIQLTRIA